jgi:tight adherence protein C
MPPVLLALATFVSLAVIAAGAAWLVSQWNSPMFARLRALAQPAGRGAESDVRVLAEERPRNAVERLLTGLGRRATQTREAPEAAPQAPTRVTLAQQLVQAGIRRPNGPALLMGIRVVVAIAMATIGVLLVMLVSPTFIPLAFTLALIGFVIPRFVVARMAENRRGNVQRHLPDAIDLLLLCVEGGLGLNAALVRVAEERSDQAEDPIGQELTLLAKELQVGVSRRDAFRNLADRTGSSELRSLATHLLHSERFGSSIGGTLRAQSESMRTHRRLLAEEQANKTQIKLLFPLILFIFPPVMIVILMPAVMRLMEALAILV